MSARSACWSITINNPTEEELQFTRVIANHWKITGQLEKGKEGTVHYQGMLETPQKPAFSTVKTALPRAHIEAARKRDQLAKYVQKEETRVALVEPKGSYIPTLFEYQANVAAALDIKAINEEVFSEDGIKEGQDVVVMRHVNRQVSRDIESGMHGIEFIAINPMWIASWKKFWRSIITRHGREVQAAHRPEGNPSTPRSGQEGAEDVSPTCGSEPLQADENCGYEVD